VSELKVPDLERQEPEAPELMAPELMAPELMALELMAPELMALELMAPKSLLKSEDVSKFTRKYKQSSLLKTKLVVRLSTIIQARFFSLHVIVFIIIQHKIL
jgi:hypothetical protein